MLISDTLYKLKFLVMQKGLWENLWKDSLIVLPDQGYMSDTLIADGNKWGSRAMRTNLRLIVSGNLIDFLVDFLANLWPPSM